MTTVAAIVLRRLQIQPRIHLIGPGVPVFAALLNLASFARGNLLLLFPKKGWGNPRLLRHRADSPQSFLLP